MEAAQVFMDRTALTLKSMEAHFEMQAKEEELRASNDRLEIGQHELTRGFSFFFSQKNTNYICIQWMLCLKNVKKRLERRWREQKLVVKTWIRNRKRLLKL